MPKSGSGVLRVASFFAVWIALVLSASGAHATVVSPFQIPLVCHGKLPADQANLNVVAPGVLIPPASIDIVCPITKTTSGPGVTSGDAISNVHVTASFGSMTCTLRSYQVDPRQATGNGTSNVLEQSGPLSASSQDSHVVAVDLSLPMTTNYWQTANTWLYAELFCTVAANTHFFGYTVTEDGTNQPNVRIVSSAACSPSAATGSNYDFYADVDKIYGWGGYLESLHQDGSTYFSTTCPSGSAPGSYVQMALGPHISSTTNLMGCGLAGQPATWQYVPPLVGTSDPGFPPETLIFPHSSSNLVCEIKNHPPDGDAKMYSFRTTADPSFGADPTCATGIISGNTCCAASCGVCGGSNCSNRPGGGHNCCGGVIAKDKKYCGDVGPGCTLADPLCRTGVINGNVCCTKTCNSCGGSCTSLPAGVTGCCVAAAGRSCSGAMPPCTMP
jgi:hypothetical protein